MQSIKFHPSIFENGWDIICFLNMPIKDPKKNKFLLMDTKLSILIISLNVTIIMLLAFTLWFHHKSLKILCNPKYSIKITLKFILCTFYKICNMEIIWKWLKISTKLMCWVSEFAHKELTYSQKDIHVNYLQLTLLSILLSPFPTIASKHMKPWFLT